MTFTLVIETLALPTVLTVLAFFVFFAASKSQGRLRLFGYVLGWWLIMLVFALLLMVALPALPALSPSLNEPRYDRWLNES